MKEINVMSSEIIRHDKRCRVCNSSRIKIVLELEDTPLEDQFVDDNVVKHALYSPGYHIPVHSVDHLYFDFADCVLILDWQHRDAIIDRHRKYIEKGGEFLIPLPQVKVIKGF